MRNHFTNVSNKINLAIPVNNFLLYFCTLLNYYTYFCDTVKENQ